MNHFLSSFALSLGLVMPVLAACSGATTADPVPADGSGDTASTDDGNVESVDSDVKSGKKKACSAVGGTCVGLSPSSCTGGHFADATQVSCGSGVGAACCIQCPVLSPPAPGFCPDGKVVVRKGANGCDAGFECEKQECPSIVQPPPGFCPDGTLVPTKNPTTGCINGFDCKPKPNACTAAGGTCVGLAPGSCPSGNWADYTTHSCGTGIGVGCCLP